jgi:endonuclease YncB( thermonuclease family)
MLSSPWITGNAVSGWLHQPTRAGARWLSLLALAAVYFTARGCQAATDLTPKPDAETSTLKGRVVGIADGDTLTLLVGREQVRIRLAQIDAPESNQPYGKKSKAALSALAFQKQARVEVVDIDRYGRTVGEVFVDGIDVNHEMVREGHAWAYTQYSHSTEIIELEDHARTEKKGLWALPESQREPPWIWRHPPQAQKSKPRPLECGTRTYCSEMASCEEARFYFEKCSVQSLDGDGDGKPCESLCAAAR